MNVNENFKHQALVHSADMAWLNSPVGGVKRRSLDRVGGEIARATTIVQYQPQSYFSPHVHHGGEEFFVMSGEFQDEHGNYPAGSYVRNPPQSAHTPGSDLGCAILVKLWQFEADDRNHIRINSNDVQVVPHASIDGVSIMPLYSDGREDVAIYICQPGVSLEVEPQNGLEILLLDGELCESGERLKRHSWLRLPAGDRLDAQIGDGETRFWLKCNHLANVDKQIERVNAI